MSAPNMTETAKNSRAPTQARLTEVRATPDPGQARHRTWNQMLHHHNSARKPLLGAFAGIVAATIWGTVRAPFARVKLLLQVAPEIDPSPLPRLPFPNSWLTCARNVVEKDGWIGFWRGNGYLIAQQLVFRFFDRVGGRFFFNRAHIERGDVLGSALRRFAGAAFDAVVKTGLFYPLDVVRTRSQIRVGSVPRRVEDVRTKRKLYSGFWASVLSCLAYKVTYDVCFGITGGTHRNFWIRHFVRGYVSTAIAKTVAYPFLTVSRRQMVAIRGKYRNDWHAFRKIVREEGLWTLWRGFGLNFFGTLLATLATISLKSDV